MYTSSNLHVYSKQRQMLQNADASVLHTSHGMTVSLAHYHLTVQWKTFKLMSCEVYLPEMSPIIPPVKLHFWEEVCVWLRIHYRVHVCICAYMPACAYGWVALCPVSLLLDAVVSGRVKNFKRQLFCSTEGRHLIRRRMRMCAVWAVWAVKRQTAVEPAGEQVIDSVSWLSAAQLISNR